VSPVLPHGTRSPGTDATHPGGPAPYGTQRGGGGRWGAHRDPRIRRITVPGIRLVHGGRESLGAADDDEALGLGERPRPQGGAGGGGGPAGDRQRP